jgi:hypothetical protein
LPEPVVVPVGVNVPWTVTVAPELMVRPLKAIVSAAWMSGWLPPLLTVAVSLVLGKSGLVVQFQFPVFVQAVLVVPVHVHEFARAFEAVRRAMAASNVARNPA